MRTASRAVHLGACFVLGLGGLLTNLPDINVFDALLLRLTDEEPHRLILNEPL